MDEGSDPAPWRQIARAAGAREFCLVKAVRGVALELREMPRPLILVGAGTDAIAAVLRAALDGPERPSGIVLIDGLPVDRLPVPTMVLRGRQSEILTHENAVLAVSRLTCPYPKRLAELETCGSRPQIEAPDALGAALAWFADAVYRQDPTFE